MFEGISELLGHRENPREISKKAEKYFFTAYDASHMITRPLNLDRMGCGHDTDFEVILGYRLTACLLRKITEKEDPFVKEAQTRAESIARFHSERLIEGTTDKEDRKLFGLRLHQVAVLSEELSTIYLDGNPDSGKPEKTINREMVIRMKKAVDDFLDRETQRQIRGKKPAAISA